VSRRDIGLDAAVRCGGKKNKKPRSISEVQEIIKGVQQWGEGNWAVILSRSKVLRRREKSTLNLKNKWRSMIRYKVQCNSGVKVTGR